MTSERETSRSIDEQAADWIARLDRAELSTADSHDLTAWLRGDPRRRGALLRADALALMSESARALGPQFEPQRFAPVKQEPRRSPVSRRRVLAWAGAGGAAASLLALGIGAPAFGAITTGRGEVRLVTLDDGSSVMLNTETSLQVRYSQSERRVVLLYGEAYFTTVRGQARPFLVDVATARLRAEPGTFRVRKLDRKPIDVLVDQGSLSVQTVAMAVPLTLNADTRIALPASGSGADAAMPRSITSDVISRELAWRDGKVAFEGERLDQAAAELARYSRTRVEIADPVLAAEPISGLFAAADPVGFGRAVAGIFDARMDVRGDVVTLSRQPRALKK